MKTLVVYHGPACLDGLMAAAVAKMRFPHDIEFVVGKYQSSVDLSIFKNKEVFILDFSYPKETMKAIADVAQVVFWLDHHKSAFDALGDLDHPNFVNCFNNEFSGAVLAWKFFYPHEDVPYILKLVQDRDLWKWEYTDTEAVMTALYSYPANVEVMYNFLSAGREQLDQLKHEGKALVRARHLEIEKTLAAGVRKISWGLENGDVIEVPIINCPVALTSEVGNILSEQYPFAIMYFDQGSHRNFSLRSSDKNPNHVDVSAIAYLYGGGGHKHAAGFKQHIDNYEIIL